MIARLRRLLLVPAAALILIGAPALAIDEPNLGRPTTTHVELLAAPASPNARSAPPAATPTTEPSATTTPTTTGPSTTTTPPTTTTGVPSVTVATSGWSAVAEVDADLVGVTWSGDPTTEFRIEARYDGGEWRPAGEIASDDLGADDGLADAASAAAARRTDNPNATEPVWLGGADAVRVTIVNGSADAVTLEAVDTEEISAPGGSAGALGVSFPGAPDRAGYALALVLAGVALTAVAVGWSPWRSRRQVALLVVIVLLAPAAASHAAVPNQPVMTMRSQWGGDLAWNPSADCAPGPEIARTFKFAVVHHTVNSNTYAPPDSTGIVRAIWQYHVGTLGYCDIAYNFLIDRYGKIFEGRRGGIDMAVIAAHTGGFNTASTGVAWIGTWTAEQPPQAAWDAMVNLLAWKLSVHGVDPKLGFTTTSNGGGSRWPAGTVVSFPSAIVGHRDLWPTECPGDAFYPRMAELRAAVQPKIGFNAPVDRWEGLGGFMVAHPAVAAWSAGRLDVFVQGTDGQLWHKWYANGWSGWEPLGGVLTDGPAAAAWSAGRLDVFIRGTDGQLWHKWYDGWWSGWEPLGGGLIDGPAVAAWLAGRLDVFVRGTDSQLWHKWYDGRWSGWEPLGGVLTDAPAAASWDAGRLDVFVRGTDAQLWHKWYDGGWSGWEGLGGVLKDAPAATSWEEGSLDVFVRGSDDQLYNKSYGDTWSLWEPLGGILTDGPGAAAWAPGRLDVFVRAIDAQLFHKWFDGAWS